MSRPAPRRTPCTPRVRPAGRNRGRPQGGCAMRTSAHPRPAGDGADGNRPSRAPLRPPSACADGPAMPGSPAGTGAAPREDARGRAPKGPAGASGQPCTPRARPAGRKRGCPVPRREGRMAQRPPSPAGSGQDEQTYPPGEERSNQGGKQVHPIVAKEGKVAHRRGRPAAVLPPFRLLSTGRTAVKAL